MDLFESKNISPMLLGSVQTPFDSDEYIFELKLDGVRCLAYLDEKQTILRNKRNKDVSGIYPELKNIHLQAKKRCIIDGELVVLNDDGTPNFFALQKRSLMTDKFRIEIEASKSKVNFVAYDILYYGDKEITDLPLTKRKEILKNNIQENEVLSVSRVIDDKGIELFEMTKKLNLEGIVAKKKDSKYHIGKRSKDWLKIKNLIDEDLVICGITFDDDNKIKNVLLGEFKNKKLIARGKVYLNISKEIQKKILNFAIKNTLDKPLFEKRDENVLWIKPKLYCTIQYMTLTKDGNMRQPVFKSLLEDK